MFICFYIIIFCKIFIFFPIFYFTPFIASWFFYWRQYFILQLNTLIVISNIMQFFFSLLLPCRVTHHKFRCLLLRNLYRWARLFSSLTRKMYEKLYLKVLHFKVRQFFIQPKHINVCYIILIISWVVKALRIRVKSTVNAQKQKQLSSF